MKSFIPIIAMSLCLSACSTAEVGSPGGDSESLPETCEPGDRACLQDDLYRCADTSEWVFQDGCGDRDLVCLDGRCVDGSTLPDGDGEGESEDSASACNTKVPEFVAVKGGAFEMGCPYTEDNWPYGSGWDADCRSATPHHTVTVPDFEIMISEVTYAMWRSFMGNNPPHYDGCDACPVSYLTRAQAISFCATIDARLPSEAEWEYAARGGTKTDFSNGDDPDKLDEIAWCDKTWEDDWFVHHPVCQLVPNAYGLYDMIGNAGETVMDYWHYIDGKPYKGAPTDGSAWLDDPYTFWVGDDQVLGSVIRSSCKYAWSRTFSTVPDRTDGFRCAR